MRRAFWIFALLVLAGQAAARPGDSPGDSSPADQVSPLPPPATRADLRGKWFEFLSALNEDELTSARIALDGIKKTADRTGIVRLSDFSRAAVFQARRAERLLRFSRAEAALDAAVSLDPDLVDARWARTRFYYSRGQTSRAAAEAAATATAIFTAYESRREFLSDAGIVAGISFVAAAAALIIALFVRHVRRILHDADEITQDVFAGWGSSALLVALLALPVAFSFGPLWLILYWAALVFLYAEGSERFVVAVLLVVMGCAGPVALKIADENLISRSPLVAAAVDLQEKKEEGGSVDLLLRASQIFPEDADVWYLLGRFAQRREDYDQAAVDFAHSVKNDPANFRSLVALGNVRFWQGDLPAAIQNYRDALTVRGGSALAYYNLALAQGDAYLFDQQKESLANARRLAPSIVDHWIESPVAGRVLSLDYSLPEAEARTRLWGRQAKSQLLPGMSTDTGLARKFTSPLALAPWIALAVALLLKGLLGRRGFGASECLRCGKAFCSRCRLKGSSPVYCRDCDRITGQKESLDISTQMARSDEMKKQQRLRRRERRLISLILPGARRVFLGQPVSGFIVLFIFFLPVTIGLLSGRLFPVASTLSAAAFPVYPVAAFSLAFLIWLFANVKTLRS